MSKDFTQRLRRLLAREDGIAAMEFALVVPFMLLLLIGSAAVFDAIQAKNRSIMVSDTTADLISRALEMSDEGVADAFQSAEMVLGDYADRVDMWGIVTGYVFDEDDQRWEVAWSEGHNTPDYHAVGESKPKGFFPETHSKEMVVYVEIETEYSSSLYLITPAKLNYREETTRLPRYVSSISYDPQDLAAKGGGGGNPNDGKDGEADGNAGGGNDDDDDDDDDDD